MIISLCTRIGGAKFNEYIRSLEEDGKQFGQPAPIIKNQQPFLSSDNAAVKLSATASWDRAAYCGKRTVKRQPLAYRESPEADPWIKVCVLQAQTA